MRLKCELISSPLSYDNILTIGQIRGRVEETWAKYASASVSFARRLGIISYRIAFGCVPPKDRTRQAGASCGELH
jgi:hypothetical protein